MKTIPLLLLMSVSLFSQTLPPDASALQAKRDAKVAEINRLYVEALEKLLKNAMANGSIDAATAIQKEIEAATPNPFFRPEEIYEDTVWVWGSGGDLKLTKGGRATHTKWVRSGKWSVENGSLVIESDTGLRFKVMFDSADVAQVISANGGLSTSLTRK